MAKPIRKYLIRALGIAIVLAASVWLVDWLLLRHNIGAGAGFGQIEVHRRFAIHLKNRQIQQRMEKPHQQGCVNSMFTHYGEPPCWYLARHANDVQDLDAAPWQFWNDDRP